MWNMKCLAILVVSGATEIVIKAPKTLGSNTRKTFSRLSTKNGCVRNIERKENTSHQLEWWCSPLVQDEKW
jgi:hypothetical protein